MWWFILCNIWLSFNTSPSHGLKIQESWDREESVFNSYSLRLTRTVFGKTSNEFLKKKNFCFMSSKMGTLTITLEEIVNCTGTCFIFSLLYLHFDLLCRYSDLIYRLLSQIFGWIYTINWINWFTYLSSNSSYENRAIIV